MTITSNLRGTSELHWRIGLSGPAIYQGSDDPSMSPPAPIEASLNDGDLFIRTGTLTEGIHVFEQGGWYRMPTGLGGGTYEGPIIHNGNLSTNADTTLGSDSADAVTINGTAAFPNSLSGATAITIGGDTNLYRESAGILRSDTSIELGGNFLSEGLSKFADGSETIPSLAFINDTDTGFYRVGDDQLASTVGGVQAFQIDEIGGNITFTVRGDFVVDGTTTTVDTANLQVTDNIILVNKDEMGAGVSLGEAGIEVERGTLTNVAWLWNEGGDFWCPDGDLINQNVFIGNDFTVDGTVLFNNTGPTTLSGPIRLPDGLATTPSYTFTSDPSTGVFKPGFNELGFTTNGMERIHINSIGNVGIGASPSVIGTYQLSVQSNTNDIAIFTNGSEELQIGSNGGTDIRLETGVGQGIRLDPAGTTRLRIGNNINGVVSTSNIIPSATSTYSLGNISSVWTMVYATATSAQYADLAERYVGPNMVPGTVVCIMDHPDYEVMPSEEQSDERVLGVVSTNPAFIMNDTKHTQDQPIIALKGRVPVRVSEPVKRGDLLVTDKSGRAKIASIEDRRYRPLSVFAKVIRESIDGIAEAVIV